MGAQGTVFCGVGGGEDTKRLSRVSDTTERAGPRWKSGQWIEQLQSHL